MLKRVTLENFFSFGASTTIALNPDVNILVGINGSGKSNFLKAIRLLHEAVAGQGFEKLSCKNGGFANVANVCGGKKDYIKLSYVFSFNVLEYQGEKEEDWTNDRYDSTYEIKIHRLGATGYYFEERLISKNGALAPSEFIAMHNNKGKLLLLLDAEAESGELIDYPNEKYLILFQDRS